jgi:hypothetical protein
VGPSGSGGGGTGVGGSDAGGNTAVSTAISVTVTTGTEGSSSSGVINPCGTECIDTELCDGANEGLDDNCNGEVDEGCPCSPGQATDCFKGDPSYRSAPGCFPGSMRCNEFGQWGVCDGGAHAFGPEPCQEGSLEGCHPITAVPFQNVNLKDGTGTFGQGADPGSESWTVTCPADVPSCPAVSGSAPPDDFQPLQSGEYTVTYNKEVDGQPESCSYPLFVGARGLRVELTWDYSRNCSAADCSDYFSGDDSTDLDLHMLQPGVTGPMGSSVGNGDCGYINCTLDDFLDGGGPEWFPESAPPGEPVSWYLDPVAELNSCYYAPRGVGAEWADEGRGCHNPRLDLDNVNCDPTETNVNSTSFCAPENINIDFPPKDQWIRVGVHDYDGTNNVPTLKIFCDGALKAVLGPEGFNTPITLDGDDVWLAADVAFVQDECSAECVVNPIYTDPNTKTPFVGSDPATGPAFPALPTPGD